MSQSIVSFVRTQCVRHNPKMKGPSTVRERGGSYWCVVADATVTQKEVFDMFTTLSAKWNDQELLVSSKIDEKGVMYIEFRGAKFGTTYDPIVQIGNPDGWAWSNAVWVVS